jgi:hypothetical protein
VVAALIPMSLSAASCDPLFKAQAERMGVTINRDGVPVIVAVPCPDERVVTMELLDGESVLAGTPTAYWRVRSDRAVVGKTYVVPIDNQPPSGCSCGRRPARKHPSGGQRQTLTNVGDPSGAGREFRIGDLRVGEVLARGGQFVSLDEFMMSAWDVC